MFVFDGSSYIEWPQISKIPFRSLYYYDLSFHLHLKYVSLSLFFYFSRPATTRGGLHGRDTSRKGFKISSYNRFYSDTLFCVKIDILICYCSQNHRQWPIELNHRTHACTYIYTSTCTCPRQTTQYRFRYDRLVDVL